MIRTPVSNPLLGGFPVFFKARPSENLCQGRIDDPHHRRFIDSSLPYFDLRGPRLISSRDFSILTPIQREAEA